MEKYKIEKGSVQETLVIPLYAGVSAHSGFPGFIRIQRQHC